MKKETPDFQETLKRMLKSPPKKNKPLNAEGGKSDKQKRAGTLNPSDGRG